MKHEDFAATQEMIRLFQGFISARAVFVVAKLGIADKLVAGGRTAEELATALDVNAEALYRVLRLLSGAGVFHQDEKGLFFLTSLGETLRTDSPNSVRDYALLYHEDVIHEGLNDLLGVVRTGEPAFDRIHGQSLFQYLRENPEDGVTLQKGLASRTRFEIEAAMEAYDFSDCRLIVDAGGGSGSFLSAILTKYDQTSGILFDQEPAIEAAKAGQGGPLPRCELVVGDFFESVPPGADTYIFKLALYDWNDDQVLQILINCRKAILAKGKLLVVEALIDKPNVPALAYNNDMTYLTVTTGQVRTKDEFAYLFGLAGFDLNRVIPSASQLMYLEANPE